MNSPIPRSKALYPGDAFSMINTAIQDQGYIVIDNIFDTKQLESLFIEIKHIDSRNFHEAGIGRRQVAQVNSFVRRDRVHWIDENYLPVKFYLNWMEQLRLHLNRELYLGLFDFECHFAHYPQGAFYKKHFDAFHGESNRVLSTILYLNPSWQLGNGGELVIYKPGQEDILGTVYPTFGTMVLFLSEDFAHEVLPARVSRYSLTGWFRKNML